jgi:hypothetical protein
MVYWGIIVIWNFRAVWVVGVRGFALLPWWLWSGAFGSLRAAMGGPDAPGHDGFIGHDGFMGWGLGGFRGGGFGGFRGRGYDGL